MESPSSELLISKSFHRIQKLEPLATLKPVIEELTLVRLPDALPSSSPAVTTIQALK